MKKICRAILLSLCLSWSFGLQAGESADTENLANHLMAISKVSAGVCAMPADDGDLALTLARKSALLTYALVESEQRVAALRKRADADGVLGRRFYVDRGQAHAIPLANHYADVVIVAGATDEKLTHLKPTELLRILSPYHGKLIVGHAKGRPGTLSRSALENWLQATGISGATIQEDAFGLWGILTAPPLKGADDWTHLYHDSDQNPVSSDRVTKPPYVVQWLGKPYNASHVGVHICAGGRFFSVLSGASAIHTFEYELTARNAFNGRVLWRRPLPKD